MTNAATDWLTITRERTRLVSSALRWMGKNQVTDPYFSPALAGAEQWEHFGQTKMYIMTGTREVFYDEDVSLARNMEAAGVDVLLREVSDSDVSLDPLESVGWRR
jgi:acetyl esterase/lipase